LVKKPPISHCGALKNAGTKIGKLAGYFRDCGGGINNRIFAPFNFSTLLKQGSQPEYVAPSIAVSHHPVFTVLVEELLASGAKQVVRGLAL